MISFLPVVAELKNIIWDAIQKATSQMLEGLFWEAIYCLKTCRDIDDCHIEKQLYVTYTLNETFQQIKIF